MSGLTIEMLSAREGDCILLTYEDGDRKRRLLVDGGRRGTYKALRRRLLDIPDGERELELLVITHVDRDHIEGVLALLADGSCPVTFRDIWFNGYAHLVDPDSREESFGPVQGELLTTELLKRDRKWNAHFQRKAVYVRDSVLPVVPLRGGFTLTVLSPDAGKLQALAPVWEDNCAKAGLHPTKTKKIQRSGEEVFGGMGIAKVESLAASAFEKDTAEANGSSIGLLVEHDGVRVLLGADCHVDRLIQSLGVLAPDGGRIRLDAFKIPHHGSAHNLSKDLLDRINCPRYLISTSGAYFKHPTQATVARVLKFGQPTDLFFNYISAQTRTWASPTLRQKYSYNAHYPDLQNNGYLAVYISG